MQTLAPVARNKPTDELASAEATNAVPKPPVKSERELLVFAQKLVQQKRYSDARDTFKEFIENYSESPFVAYAHFWLGELYLISGELDEAKREFEFVVEQFPGDAKAPDALLKLGYVYYDSGLWVQARDEFGQLLNHYPSSTAARLAKARMLKMTQEGH